MLPLVNRAAERRCTPKGSPCSPRGAVRQSLTEGVRTKITQYRTSHPHRLPGGSHLPLSSKGRLSLSEQGGFSVLIGKNKKSIDISLEVSYT